MYNITDIAPKCSTPLVIEYPKCTILRALGVTPEFKKFKRIVDIAGMDDFFADKEESFTVFVPHDSYLESVSDDVFMHMDRGTARKIVTNMTMKRRIPSELLRQSPSGLWSNLSSDSRLFVATAKDVTMINESIAVVQFDIECGNGIIHVTDGVLWQC
jgi:uncharacterized surface protein with fasciclin (FAS1) repeats